MNKEPKKEKYRCYYCNKKVDLEELKDVDLILKKMKEEYYEFLLDDLPKVCSPRKKPYIHLSELGYDVLNICKRCLQKVKKD